MKQRLFQLKQRLLQVKQRLLQVEQRLLQVQWPPCAQKAPPGPRPPSSLRGGCTGGGMVRVRFQSGPKIDTMPASAAVRTPW